MNTKARYKRELIRRDERVVPAHVSDYAWRVVRHSAAMFGVSPPQRVLRRHHGSRRRPEIDALRVAALVLRETLFSHPLNVALPAGQERWTIKLGDESTDATPASHPILAVLLCRDQSLFATLRCRHGERLWPKVVQCIQLLKSE